MLLLFMDKIKLTVSPSFRSLHSFDPGVTCPLKQWAVYSTVMFCGALSTISTLEVIFCIETKLIYFTTESVRNI